MSTPKFYRNSYLYLALGIIVVFLGFTQSYFGKLSQTSLPYHLHGISATLWMLLLVIQPYLYRINKLKAHRFLGWSSVILIPTIVLAGTKMMQLMIQHQESYPPNTVYQLAFIDAFTLLEFIILFALAIYFRKNLKLHARFMVCTIFGPLNPALTRVFLIVGMANNITDALTYSYLLLELVLLILVIKERSSKEMRYTYLPVLALTIAQHLLMYSANSWEWWVAAMNSFTGY